MWSNSKAQTLKHELAPLAIKNQKVSIFGFTANPVTVTTMKLTLQLESSYRQYVNE